MMLAQFLQGLYICTSKQLMLNNAMHNSLSYAMQCCWCMCHLPTEGGKADSVRTSM